MNKLKFLFRFALAWALFALAMVGKANAQCAIIANADGCVGVPYDFELSPPRATGTYDSMVWNFGNAKQFDKNNPVNIWYNPTGGAITVTVTIYKGGVVDCAASASITVHANPIADYKLLSPTPQCFNGNQFRFQNLSTTPSLNPIIYAEFIYGDGKLDSFKNTMPGFFPGTGFFTYTPPTPAGGFFDTRLRLRDSKGCTHDTTFPSQVQIRPDLGANFVTPNPRRCDTTQVTLTNTSLIQLADVANYSWELGDGTTNTTNYGSVTHIYRTDGCFNARLIIQSLDGCLDTAIKQAACNVKKTLNVSVKNGDVQCFSAQSFVFSHPPIQGAQFLWEFDDVPSGPDNFDFQNWDAPHDFTATGPYNVIFRMQLAGCQFDTVYRVHVKGPGAGIETKPAPFIAPSQRYQCKIKDTVYFPNISSYYLNDDSALNDFYYNIGTTGAIFQLINKDSFHIDFDTISRVKGVNQSFNTRTGRAVSVSANGDTIMIDDQRVIMNGLVVVTVSRFNGVRWVKGTVDASKDAFNNPGKHTERVWDFDDNVAPQCTTDSRVIYPKLAKYKNTGYRNLALAPQDDTLGPKNTYDSLGRWINCNFSSDSLPKHWYSPGEERCYTVRLKLKDTSSADPNIQGLTASGNDPAGSTACESEATARLALQGPDASGVDIRERRTCYGDPKTFGIVFKFDKTKPACDRQTFWIHLDSLADRLDNTPNTFDKWIHQSGTVVDRLFTPWPLATLSLPPNVGSIFWQYQPTGAYPSKITDKSGWVTFGFRVQNGIDPVTGQPCIDEKWYHKAYRYIQANNNFRFYRPEDPSYEYTFEKQCAPIDVYVKRDSLAISLPGGETAYTFASDSIGVDVWTWKDGSADVDSFYRYMCDANTGLCYSYVKRFFLPEDASAPILTDSFVTRIYDPVAMKTIFVRAEDSVPQITRTHRYTRPGRYEIEHLMITQSAFEEVNLNTGLLERKYTICDNVDASAVRSAVIGFISDLLLDDSIVCRNVPIQFFDSARYWLEFRPPFGPDWDAYDYWGNPFQYADLSPRPQPRPAPRDYEKIRWDFGDGKGWNSSVPPNPSRSYPEPGKYTIKIEYTDSVGCKQVNERNITVTGVSANFKFDPVTANCKPTVNFIDTSLILDPCRILSNSICDDIIGWKWNFGDNKPNNQSISIIPSPSKVYTGFGDYDVKLVVETSNGCFDSIVRTISLEGPRPRFDFAADSIGCAPFTVELLNQSINPTPTAEWLWDFGDKTTLTDKTQGGADVSHTYLVPGTYEIYLTQTDQTPGSFLPCKGVYPEDTFGRRFFVKVLPQNPTNFTVSDSIVCVEDTITFTDASDTIYSTFRWIFGETGDTVVQSKISGGGVQKHAYAKPGVYYVQSRPLYTPPPGEPACPTSAVKRITVADVQAIIGNCDDSSKLPFKYFENQSRNYSKYSWNLGDGNGFVDGPTLADAPNASKNYGENQGNYNVLLAVESPEGCLDTAYCDFSYNYIVAFTPYNVFTPGKDNLNNFFEVTVLNEEMYQLSIFNRWGEKVYEADSKEAIWDGKHLGTKDDCPAGVYFVVINYRLRGGSDKTYRGSLTLLREK